MAGPMCRGPEVLRSGFAVSQHINTTLEISLYCDQLAYFSEFLLEDHIRQLSSASSSSSTPNPGLSGTVT